jgi:hypothetical protein
MKPGGSVREVSDMGRTAGVFSLNLRRFRRAQCKRPDPPLTDDGLGLATSTGLRAGVPVIELRPTLLE